MQYLIDNKDTLDYESYRPVNLKMASVEQFTKSKRFSFKIEMEPKNIKEDINQKVKDQKFFIYVNFEDNNDINTVTFSTLYTTLKVETNIRSRPYIQNMTDRYLKEITYKHMEH